jgi:hypothetical protein
MNAKRIKSICAIGTVLAFVTLGTKLVAAREYPITPEFEALLKVLPNAKVSLADGVKQATKSPETPISAKFELDDNKKLSLSIYTVEKGLTVDPEHNVLKELAGSPEQAPWKPETEVFKDVEHVARSSGQLTLVSLSPHSLGEIIEKAQKDQPGTVFSITPAVSQRRLQFVVLVADQGKVIELDYDLMTGTLLGKK